MSRDLPADCYHTSVSWWDLVDDCDVTDVVLGRRAIVVFKVVDTDVAVAVIDVTDGDDDDDVIPLTVFARAWSPPAPNDSSLRNFGRGGMSGFGPAFFDLGLAAVCVASDVTTTGWSFVEDGGGSGAGASAVPDRLRTGGSGLTPTSKILTCVRSTTTRRPSAAKSSACGWTSCVELE